MLQYEACGRQPAATVAALKESEPTKEGGFFKWGGKYAASWRAQLLKFGSLLRRPHPTGQRKVPTAPAIQAAEALGAGFETTVFPYHGPSYKTRTHYTSFAQACAFDPVVNQIMTKYKVTEDTLRKRMLEVRPDLAFTTINLKPLLDAANMTYRQGRARVLCGMPDKFWEDIAWVDETKIIIMGMDSSGVRAWLLKNAGDADGVIHVGGKTGNAVHIHIYAAVHAKYGLVAYQFSTGTTGLGSRRDGNNWPRVMLPVEGVDLDDIDYEVRGGGSSHIEPFELITAGALPKMVGRRLMKYQGSSNRVVPITGPGL